MVIGAAGCGGGTRTVTVTSTAASASLTTSATTTSKTTELPYSGEAPNGNYGPATDQSGCPGVQATVGPNTSCGFAQHVAAIVATAHRTTGHFPADVTASSPATGRTYRLQCSILGFGTELVCATLPPATGVVVVPFRTSSAAAPPSTSTSTPQPTPPPSAPAVEGPGSTSHATDAEFCSTHQCIENFPNGNGYIVQCADGEWSHSGGLSGACSDHGGEG